MKKYIVAIVIMACLLTGCNFNSYVYIGQDEKKTSTSWSMSYQKFSGHESRNIEIEDIDVPLQVEIDTEKGAFTLTLLLDDEEVHVFSQSEEFTFTKAGSYTLRMDGDDHKGGFSAQWK